MFYSLDMFNFVVTQIQWGEILQIIQILNSVDKVVVQIEFGKGLGERAINSSDLIVP